MPLTEVANAWYWQEGSRRRQDVTSKVTSSKKRDLIKRVGRGACFLQEAAILEVSLGPFAHFQHSGGYFRSRSQAVWPF